MAHFLAMLVKNVFFGDFPQNKVRWKQGKIFLQFTENGLKINLFLAGYERMTGTPNYMSFQRLHKRCPTPSPPDSPVTPLYPTLCYPRPDPALQSCARVGAVDHKTGQGGTPTGNSFGPISGLKPPMSHRTMHKCWQELPPLYPYKTSR